MTLKQKQSKPRVEQTDFVTQEDAALSFINKGGSVAKLDSETEEPTEQTTSKISEYKDTGVACFSLRVPKSFVPRLDALRKQKDLISSRNQTIIEILEKAFQDSMV